MFISDKCWIGISFLLLLLAQSHYDETWGPRKWNKKLSCHGVDLFASSQESFMKELKTLSRQLQNSKSTIGIK